MASIHRLHTGSWHARVALPNHRSISTTRPTREEAEQWADTTEAQVRAGQWDQAPPRPTNGWDPRDVYITRSPEGLDIHVPTLRLSPTLADELESVVLGVLDHEERGRA